MAKGEVWRRTIYNNKLTTTKSSFFLGLFYPAKGSFLTGKK